jgi:putative NADH-flavin reductase
MPVIVIGADTPLGGEIAKGMLPREGEVRVFVTDPGSAAALKDLGVKIATGDVSDGSHIGGAALNCFCAVLVTAAASDDRERAFAATADDVATAWAEGIADAGVSRIIWVGEEPLPESIRSLGREHAAVSTLGRSTAETVAEVRRLEEAARILEDG